MDWLLVQLTTFAATIVVTEHSIAFIGLKKWPWFPSGPYRPRLFNILIFFLTYRHSLCRILNVEYFYVHLSSFPWIFLNSTIHSLCLYGLFLRIKTSLLDWYHKYDVFEMITILFQQIWVFFWWELAYSIVFVLILYSFMLTFLSLF